MSRFVTFDGAVEVRTLHQRPDRYRHLEQDLGSVPRIARGGGYSYAAASFGEGVIVQDMRAFDRILDFDGDATVRVEAGITLLRLQAWARERARQLPALPGYPLITVGGCIAADVHGKNSVRDGTFCDRVVAMTLYHPAFGFRKVTRDDDAGLFDTTCGGFGMTGLIVDATLRLSPLPAPGVAIEVEPTESYAAALKLLEQADECDFAYTWHDGSARAGDAGRGLVFRGYRSEAAASDRAFRGMTAESRARCPVSLWNRWSIRAANAIFYSAAKRRPRSVRTSFEASFPFARQTLYHRLYGRRGLAEVQILASDATAARFLDGMHRLIDAHDPCVAMVSIKRFRGRRRALSMTGEGWLVAVDAVRDHRLPEFLADLDRLALECGAQPNIAKDSRIPRAVAERLLPHYHSFCERLRALDPNALFQSELSRRLLP